VIIPHPHEKFLLPFKKSEKSALGGGTFKHFKRDVTCERRPTGIKDAECAQDGTDGGVVGAVKRHFLEGGGRFGGGGEAIDYVS